MYHKQKIDTMVEYIALYSASVTDHRLNCGFYIAGPSCIGFHGIVKI